MHALIQRVRSAEVRVGGTSVGEIGQGLLVFLAVEKDDGHSEQEKLLRKVLGYRVFPDDAGRMNLSLEDIGGELLVVSQFTLAADTRKGMRPSFSRSAPPDQARTLYEGFVALAEERQRAGQLSKVASGRFAADMQVSLINDGPVTFWLSTH